MKLNEKTDAIYGAMIPTINPKWTIKETNDDWIRVYWVTRRSHPKYQEQVKTEAQIRVRLGRVKHQVGRDRHRVM